MDSDTFQEARVAQNTYTIVFDDGRDAEVTVEHRRGADSTWGSGLLFDPTGTIIATAEPMRYLSYDCDTEIVATVIAKHLDESVSPDIWQVLEDQMPECVCDLDEEDLAA